jgi:hypothetical protein
VSLTLLRNPGVPEEVKKQAAVSWVSSIPSGDRRDQWQFRSEVEEVLRLVPDAYNEILRNTRNQSVILAGMLNELSPESQRVILKNLVAPVLADISTAAAAGRHGVSWSSTHYADTMFERLAKMIEMEFVTDEFRAGLTSMLQSQGPWPLDWRFGYLGTPEKEREKLLTRLLSGKIGTERSPLHTARSTSNPTQLLKLAATARQERDSDLGLVIALNPACTTEVLLEVAEALGWQGMRKVIHQATERNEIEKITAVLVQYQYLLDDDLFAVAANPSELLRQVIQAMRKAGALQSRTIQSLFGSQHLTVEAIAELPGDILVHTEIPEQVAVIIQSLLEAELGDNAEHWSLFEVLLCAGDTSIREVLKTAKAL